MSLSGGLLAARDVTVVYPGGLHALGPVSLSVAAGECVALVGPSGCGKSTLLAALAGLLAPSAGQVTRAFDGPPGVVFQDPTLMPWADVATNVALPLTLSGVARRDAQARAAAALAAAGLSGFAQARPAALSGGMRMRAALARALAAEAPALLLDEPFAAIDELGRRALDDLVLRLRDEHALAVLFVTHSVEEAVYLSDRVAVMGPRPGRLVADIRVDRAGASGKALSGDAFLASAGFTAAAAAARAALRLAEAA